MLRLDTARLCIDTYHVVTVCIRTVEHRIACDIFDRDLTVTKCRKRRFAFRSYDILRISCHFGQVDHTAVSTVHPVIQDTFLACNDEVAIFSADRTAFAIHICRRTYRDTVNSRHLIVAHPALCFETLRFFLEFRYINSRTCDSFVNVCFHIADRFVCRIELTAVDCICRSRTDFACRYILELTIDSLRIIGTCTKRTARSLTTDTCGNDHVSVCVTACNSIFFIADSHFICYINNSICCRIRTDRYIAQRIGNRFSTDRSASVCARICFETVSRCDLTIRLCFSTDCRSTVSVCFAVSLCIHTDRNIALVCAIRIVTHRDRAYRLVARTCSSIRTDRNAIGFRCSTVHTDRYTACSTRVMTDRYTVSTRRARLITDRYTATAVSRSLFTECDRTAACRAGVFTDSNIAATVCIRRSIQTDSNTAKSIALCIVTNSNRMIIICTSSRTYATNSNSTRFACRVIDFFVERSLDLIICRRVCIRHIFDSTVYIVYVSFRSEVDTVERICLYIACYCHITCYSRFAFRSCDILRSSCHFGQVDDLLLVFSAHITAETMYDQVFVLTDSSLTATEQFFRRTERETIYYRFLTTDEVYSRNSARFVLQFFYICCKSRVSCLILCRHFIDSRIELTYVSRIVSVHAVCYVDQFSVLVDIISYARAEAYYVVFRCNRTCTDRNSVFTFCRCYITECHRAPACCRCRRTDCRCAVFFCIRARTDCDRIVSACYQRLSYSRHTVTDRDRAYACCLRIIADTDCNSTCCRVVDFFVERSLDSFVSRLIACRYFVDSCIELTYVSRICISRTCFYVDDFSFATNFTYAYCVSFISYRISTECHAVIARYFCTCTNSNAIICAIYFCTHTQCYCSICSTAYAGIATDDRIIHTIRCCIITDRYRETTIAILSSTVTDNNVSCVLIDFTCKCRIYISFQRSICFLVACRYVSDSCIDTCKFIFEDDAVVCICLYVICGYIFYSEVTVDNEFVARFECRGNKAVNFFYVCFECNIIYSDIFYEGVACSVNDGVFQRLQTCFNIYAQIAAVSNFQGDVFVRIVAEVDIAFFSFFNCDSSLVTCEVRYIALARYVPHSTIAHREIGRCIIGSYYSTVQYGFCRFQINSDRRFVFCNDVTFDDDISRTAFYATDRYFTLVVFAIALVCIDSIFACNCIEFYFIGRSNVDGRTAGKDCVSFGSFFRFIGSRRCDRYVFTFDIDRILNVSVCHDVGTARIYRITACRDVNVSRTCDGDIFARACACKAYTVACGIDGQAVANVHRYVACAFFNGHATAVGICSGIDTAVSGVDVDCACIDRKACTFGLDCHTTAVDIQRIGIDYVCLRSRIILFQVSFISLCIQACTVGRYRQRICIDVEVTLYRAVCRDIAFGSQLSIAVATRSDCIDAQAFFSVYRYLRTFCNDNVTVDIRGSSIDTDCRVARGADITFDGKLFSFYTECRIIIGTKCVFIVHTVVDDLHFFCLEVYCYRTVCQAMVDIDCVRACNAQFVVRSDSDNVVIVVVRAIIAIVAVDSRIIFRCDQRNIISRDRYRCRTFASVHFSAGNKITATLDIDRLSFYIDNTVVITVSLCKNTVAYIIKLDGICFDIDVTTHGINSFFNIRAFRLRDRANVFHYDVTAATCVDACKVIITVKYYLVEIFYRSCSTACSRYCRRTTVPQVALTYKSSRVVAVTCKGHRTACTRSVDAIFIEACFDFHIAADSYIDSIAFRCIDTDFFRSDRQIAICIERKALVVDSCFFRVDDEVCVFYIEFFIRDSTACFCIVSRKSDNRFRRFFAFCYGHNAATDEVTAIACERFEVAVVCYVPRRSFVHGQGNAAFGIIDLTIQIRAFRTEGNVDGAAFSIIDNIAFNCY